MSISPPGWLIEDARSREDVIGPCVEVANVACLMTGKKESSLSRESGMSNRCAKRASPAVEPAADAAREFQIMQ
jgi:hypothetical protein